MFQFILYRLGQIIIHCVPKSGAYHFAQFVSQLHYKYSTRDREAVTHNLQHILNTDGDVSAQVRQVFRNFGRYLVDFFMMYRVNERFIREHVRFVGRENLERAVARGRGVIILTAHVGNWEMGAALLARMGHQLTVIALPHKERSVNDLFIRQRQKHGVIVVSTSVASRRCLVALRKGQMIALLGDRDFGEDGAVLDFLGRRTHIPKGAAFFAYKTGASILPSFVLPNPDGTYVTYFGEPIEVRGDGISQEEAILDLMKRYVTAIEAIIRQHPTQWLMFREFGIDYEHLYSHPRL